MKFAKIQLTVNTMGYAKKKSCKKDATVQLLVDDPEIGWLTASIEAIQCLLTVDSKLTLDSNCRNTGPPFNKSKTLNSPTMQVKKGSKQ